MSDLLYEVKDKIATITLNRPDKLNAFTGPMIDAWAKGLAEAQSDAHVNVITRRPRRRSRARCPAAS
jgi:enoyl-CoA hydratase/carnithine racemase